MVFERLKTVESQDDVTLLFEDILETGRLCQSQSEQFFVALQKIGDGARRDGKMTLLEGAMDFGNAAMFAVAQGTDERDDVETKFAVGQGPCSFLFRTNRQTMTWAGRIVAAADAQGQASDMLKRGDGAGGVVASPECAATA